MASVDDVAAAILQRTGPVDTFKLQKLVYYCQAWHLVWEGRPLFRARIEAWANGPVTPKLYRQHRTRYQVSTWPTGNADALSEDESESVDAVVDYYGKKKGLDLAELTHREAPWLQARQDLPLGARGDAEISLASMLEYYGGLVK